MAFGGFVFKKFTKPVHESDLQVPLPAARANNHALLCKICCQVADVFFQNIPATNENKNKMGSRGPCSGHLHIAIPRFCIVKKYTKPAHERDLQVPAPTAPAINAP